ncbi:DEBR0S2_19042g1_1 [Brettanomyces bruxellensis]|uniref:DEBR0S2_19042g1_1 n=1 Tax=Dekkera bruxellensis TaxID=5007 RepID=A0A7D9H112_DEKBR|nr:DEBR0S2_19042g1_1 [Brettanomyces bruxellensis]
MDMINSPKHKEFKSRIPTFVGRIKRKTPIANVPTQTLKSSFGKDNIYSEYVDVLDAYMNQDILSERRQLRKLRSQVELAKVQLESINEDKCEYQRKKRKLELSIKEGNEIYNKLDEIFRSRNLALNKEIQDNRLQFEQKKNEITSRFSEKLDDFKSQCEKLVAASTVDEETESNRNRRLDALNKECTQLTEKLKQTKDVLALKLANIRKELDLQLLRQDEGDESLSKSQSESAALKAQIQQAKLEVDSQKKELEAAETKFRCLQDDISKLKPFTGSIEVELKNLKKEESQLDSDIELITAGNKKLEGGLYKDMENRFSLATKRLRDSESIAFRLKREIEKYQDYIPLYVMASDSSYCVKNANFIPEASNIISCIIAHLDDLEAGISHAILLFNIEDPEGTWKVLNKFLSTLGAENISSISDSQFGEVMASAESTFKNGTNLTFNKNGKVVKASVIFLSLQLQNNIVQALNNVYLRLSTLTMVKVTSASEKAVVEKLLEYRKVEKQAAYAYRNESP